MVYVKIEDKLKNFEADIRDLCMAFFPYQKFKFIYDDELRSDFEVPDNNESPCSKENVDNIYVEGFFNGVLTGNRLKDKSEIKRQLYDFLSKLTSKKLLWGTLTGIRPVTIVTNLIEDNSDKRYIDFSDDKKDNETKASNYQILKKYLQDEYYVSNNKADELIDIANNEIKILGRDNIKNYKDRYSIYIGVPFCKSTCLYCSFTSFNIDKYGEYVDKYLDAIEYEFKNRCTKINSKFDDGSKIAQGKFLPMTLYIGGGTPTSLDEKHFERLLMIVDKYIDKKSCIEYTVEAGRPDTITKEKLKLMKEYGVTRISINPQSFNQKTLYLIGRRHKTKDVIDKFMLARSLGFDNINMDIILGLPNEHLLEVLNTLFNVYKLKPESLTVHSLALKRAARLNVELDSWTRNSYLAGIAESNKTEGKRAIDKMYAMSEFTAKILGLEPYYLYRQKNMAGNLENIGFARDGLECIYNIMMMSERHTVYGFGTATSKEVFYENGGKRIESVEGYKSVVDYCK